MTADVFIELVMSMINESNFEQADVQPLANMIARHEAIGKAFLDCVEIKEILQG